MTGRPRVYLTRRLPDEAMRFLAEECELRWNQEDRPVSRERLLREVEDVEAILSLVTDLIDGEVMEAARSLRVVANYAVGYDNVDVAEATRRGVLVTNTPDVLTAATADMAMALLLAVSRRLLEGDRLVRSGSWRGWAPLQLLGRGLSGSTLGIIGLGRIGRALSRRARAFDLRLLYWNRTRLDPAEERELGVEYRRLEPLLSESDFVSLHVAYTSDTHHLIDARALAGMKEGSYLINTARGPVVDESALADALRSGVLAGAGLDVFEREPEVHAGLVELENVVLAPHLGSATLEARTAMGLTAARNLLAACRGERPPNLVNPEAISRRRRGG